MSMPVTTSTDYPASLSASGTAPVAPGRPCRIVTEATGSTVRLGALDHGEFLSPRLLGHRGRHASIALIANRASVLADDHVELEVDIAPSTSITLTEPAGTVAYNARGAAAAYTARFHVAAGASLVWDAAAFVVAGGAAVHRNIHVDIETGGLMIMRDLLALGRSFEPAGGRLRSHLAVHYGGRPLLVEDLDLWDFLARRRAGMLESNRFLSTITMLGRPPTLPPTCSGRSERTHPTGHYWTAFAGPGGMARGMAPHAHQATAATADMWTGWIEASRPQL